MRSFVLQSVTQLSEGFLADAAFVWFFASMYPDMGSQMCLLREPFPTVFASVRLFTSMCPHMQFQRRIVNKCFLTDITDKLFHTAMNFQVYLQVVFVFVAFTTRLAKMCAAGVNGGDVCFET